MQKVNVEKDYLKRLYIIKDNMLEDIKERKVQQDTPLGESLKFLMELLDKEIEGINYIRQF